MLAIATPHLSPTEWQDVKATLNAVADCGCGEGAAPGPIRAGIGRAIDALLGAKKDAPVPLAPHLRPVRDFLCETGRSRRVAEGHVPALVAQGFSRAQIEAMALLGA
ncbi:hypothetical protein [Sphingobium sp.]|uniref:hypothetical protein n=1 Tax=Sphingobium sp. TaxID=1912891 RepID=UPI003B3B3810